MCLGQRVSDRDKKKNKKMEIKIHNIIKMLRKFNKTKLGPAHIANSYVLPIREVKNENSTF